MKRLLLLTAIFMATVTGVSAKGSPTVGQAHGGEQDTIIVKMANGAKMILHLENIKQLQAFQHYSLDSLMRELNTYVTRVDEMENTDPGSKDMTVTFNTAKSQDGKSDQITVTVQEESEQEGNVRTERHEIRLNKTFKIDVEVEEDGDNTRVNVNMPTKAERDSIRVVKAEDNYNPVDFGFHMDLGFNAFTDGANLPDLKPWGSRYVSLNWKFDSQIGGRKSPFHIVSGVHFSFYNFMFEDDIVVEEVDGVTRLVELPEVNFEKTKLTYSSINVPLMAFLEFDRQNGKDGFTIGAGPFVGYRLGSHAKYKFDGDKEKDRDSFNLSDFNYGVEGVVGYGCLNLFAKYNMNELFEEGQGPQTNVVSFGFRLFL